MTLPEISFTETSGYDMHPETEWLPAQITDIQATEGLYGPQLKWIITVTGDPLNDDGSARESWAYCSQKLTPKSKLFKWASGILGKGQVPQTLNPANFIGQQVDVMFERYAGQTDDGTPVEKEKIINIRATKTPAAKTAQPIAEAREQIAPDEMPF